MLEFLYKPQDDIQYDFILYAYILATILGVVMAVLDIAFDVEIVHGFWIIFAPFLPAVLWALVMRSAAARMKGKDGNSSIKEKDD